ncbi:MAG: polyphosphate:AMP phosphotransferase [Myxococcota bacterium]
MLTELKTDIAIDKRKYEAEMEPLMIRLQTLGRAIHEARIPVLLVLDGWEGAGKGDAINTLLARLDPRSTRVQSFFAPTEDEWMRPFLWRYWLRLPGRGQVGVFEEAWYRQLIEARVEGELSRKRFLRALDAVNSFERLLAEDGTLVVKFWLHITRREQKSRLRRWEKDPTFAFRVNRVARRQLKHYDDWLAAGEAALTHTNTPIAPWTVVEAGDRRFRRLKIVRHVCDAFERALAAKAASAPPPAPKAAAPPAPKAAPGSSGRITAGASPIDGLNLRVKLRPDKYQAEMDTLTEKIHRLGHDCYLKRLPVVVVFEGMDAAGKGGAIRRLARALDPRGYTAIPVAAPEGDEKTRHYLWRFWRHLPKAGHWAIFDRSWYGRVLVERVEGFCRPEEWGRAYGEIRDFESQILRSGAVLLKFWLHTGLKEQLRRFRERERLEHKRHKITAEDWRNREKWPQYRDAVADMLLESSTREAPWTVVEAEDKLWSRVKVMRTVAETVEAALKRADGPAGGLRL